MYEINLCLEGKELALCPVEREPDFYPCVPSLAYALGVPVREAIRATRYIMTDIGMEDVNLLFDPWPDPDLLCPLCAQPLTKLGSLLICGYLSDIAPKNYEWFLAEFEKVTRRTRRRGEHTFFHVHPANGYHGDVLLRNGVRSLNISVKTILRFLNLAHLPRGIEPFYECRQNWLPLHRLMKLCHEVSASRRHRALLLLGSIHMMIFSSRESSYR